MSLTDCSDDIDLHEIPITSQFPIPVGFVRVGEFNTAFNFGDTFETNYASGGTGPSLRWDNPSMTKLNMLVGFEFKIGPRNGIRGDDMINIKFPRCEFPGGKRGMYIANIEWHTDNTSSKAGVGAEWPHPVSNHQNFNKDNPTDPVAIGNIKDGQWHGFLAACYNNNAGNVVIKSWYNPNSTGNFLDYIYLGSSIDVTGNIVPAPKLAFASEGHSGGTHPLQIRIDEIPSNDTGGGPYKYPSTNLELRKMFTCEIREGGISSLGTDACTPTCPTGQHYDPILQRCVPDPAPPPTPGPPTPPPSGNDKFGVRKIYPDAPSGFFIETTGGGDLEEHGDFRKEWEIATPPYTAIEITGHFRVHVEREDTISIKPKGAKHTGDEYNACCNIHYVPFSGNTGKYLAKQCPHLNYKDATGITAKFDLGNIRDKWIGIKAIEWNEGSNVHWQTWVDPLANNAWKLWIDYVETNGSIGDDSDTDPPFTSAPWAGDLPPTILMRIDFPNEPPDDDVEGRFFSARQIAVTNPIITVASTPSTDAANTEIRTMDGIPLPHLPNTTYAYDAINYLNNYDHKANGSFREQFHRVDKDLNCVVVGGYVKVDGPDDEEISAQLGGGKHSPSDGGKSGRSYEIDIDLAGNALRVLKEDPHGTYHSTPITNVMNLGTRQGHYTGVIFMKVNINQIGEDCVRLKAWVDTEGMDDAGVLTPEKANWVKVLDEVDTGHWYGKPWLTPAVPGDSQATIRVDQQDESTYDFKCGFSARIRGGPANF